MLYQCGVREELLGKVCMIEREILNGLCWSIQASTLAESIYGVCSCLGVSIRDQYYCAELSDYVLLDPSMKEYSILEKTIAIVRCVCKDVKYEINCSLLCRIGVERDWDMIREEIWKEEVNEWMLVYQSYNASYLSVVLKGL